MSKTPKERLDLILERLRKPTGFLGGESSLLWAIQELTAITRELLEQTKPTIKEPHLGNKRSPRR